MPGTIELKSLIQMHINIVFFCRTIRIWNMLPIDIINADSIEIFKDKTLLWMTPLHWEKVCDTWTLE